MALHQKLSDVGLPERWSTVFKTHLGIETPQGLKYVGMESYPLLVQFITDAQEKYSLRKLLQMNDNEIKKPTDYTRRLLKKQRELMELVERLKQLKESGMNRQDVDVKYVETCCREIFQVSEHEWIKKEANFDETIRVLTQMMESIKGACTSENLDEVAFLAQVSGGLSIESLDRSIVLKGIWIKNEWRNFIFRDSNLLRLPTNTKLQLPLRPWFTEIKHFKCTREEEEFFDHVAKFGYSIPAEDNKVKPICSTEVNGKYFSTIKYWFEPMASYTFGDHQLLLSDDALSHLSKMHEKLRVGEEIEEECDAFFQTFGSHCLQGPFHFGGLFLCKCSSTCFDKLEEIQRLQIEAINFQTCKSSDKDISGPSWFKEHSKLQVFSVGGPERAVGFPDWKNGLSGSNKLWKMIDSGMSQVAVWDIILHNHRQRFEQAEALAETLKHYWRKSVSKSAESAQCGLLEQFMMLIKTFKSDTMTENNLKMIITKRREVEKQVHDPEAWALSFLPHIREYLCSIIRDPEFKKIKSLFKLVVEPVDLGIVQLFPSELQQKAMKQVYDTEQYPPPLSDFEHFCELLRQTLEIMSPTPDTFHPYFVAVAMSRIENTVLLLRHHLSKTGQQYEECFLLSILQPCGYKPETTKFSAILSKKDVKILEKKFSVWAHNFLELKNELQKQSYLMYLTVHVTHTMGTREESISSHIQFLQQQLKLMPEIESLITAGCDWETFKNQMRDIFKDVQHSLQQKLCISEEKKNSASTTHEQHSTVEEQEIQGAEANSVDKQHHSSMHTFNRLLEKLGLESLFPQKLSLQDAIQIREDTLNWSKSMTLSIYPYVMLQKIMTFDSKCRIEVKKSSIHPDDDSDSESDESTHSDSIHPMDGLLALIHCSDDFLRQDLFCRLATCQIAVPLLLPDPLTGDPTLLLWALRSIVKEFKLSDGTKCNGRIITHQTQFVSFLRLGCHEMSKSETLNGVMNKTDSDNKNTAFFHFNSPGGTNPRLLVNGLVEMSWYLPGDGLYPKPIAFTNLRGDATDPELQKQVDFLCNVSTLHVVLLSHNVLEEDATKDSATKLLKRLSQAPGGLILVETKSKRGFKSQISECIGEHLFKSTVTFIKKERSTTVFLEKLKANLKNKLEVSSEDVLLTSIARECGVAIDEDNSDCVKARQLMEDFYVVIEEYQQKNPDKKPKTLLPLQSKDFWHKWAELDKEQYRQKKNCQYETRREHRQGREEESKHECTFQEYIEAQREKMRNIRQQQYSLAMQCNELMSSFLKTLRTEKDCVLHYYLVWLKFMLDDLSRSILPPFYVRIRKKIKELSDIQQKHDDDDEVERKCQEELKELDYQLVNASFGLEHLFREVGQIFEATMAMETSTTSSHDMISSLPLIVAQLLCDGLPLELLDGDASHIAQKWISAVLNSLAEILRKKHHGSDPHVYVLSVLGVQSTGKSTLLNTMFGAQFSVSAGRCTRGAFMQLIPVHPSLHVKIGAQYFLLIDTEGLRAPERDRLESNEHDNELATFVIGMANLTLINVPGEVSGDIDDILNTVVHTFLRMSEVQLQPSCHIIHQHVAAIEADEKMMQGRLKTKYNLDKMTKTAGEEQGVETRYTYFTDVIKFDHEKDVSFFPDLWSGKPPMGRVSSDYGEEAQHLKVAIVTNCKAVTKYSLSNLRAHLERLWKALLQEDFVFTFQNIFEIVTFKTLEKKFSDWSWELRTEMSEWEREAQIKLCACNTEEKLNDVNAKLVDELGWLINEKQMEHEKKMLDYFNESNNERMLKWKPDILQRLEHLHSKLAHHAEEHCLQVYQAQKSRAEADNEKGKLSSTILEFIQKYIESLGDLSEGYDDKKLKEIFDSKWDEWISQLTSRMEPLKPPNIAREVESCIIDFFKAQRRFIQEKLTDEVNGKPLREWGELLELPIRECHIKISKSLIKKLKLESVSSKNEFFERASHITCTTFECAREYLNHIKKCDINFNPSLVTDLLRLLEEKSKVNIEVFKFTEEYEVELALTACGYAIKVFEEIADAFQRKHDPIQYVRFEMKPHFERMFINMYKSVSKEKIFADTLCHQLMEPVKDYVIESLPALVVTGMRGEYQWLSDKQSFIANILLEIGEKLDQESEDGFLLCTSFLTNVRSSLQWWAKHFTEQFCHSGSPSRLTMMAEHVINDTISFLTNQVETVTSSQLSFSTSEWLERFCSLLVGKKINVSQLKQQLMYIETEQLSDLEFFTKQVGKGLNELCDTLKKEFSHKKYSDILKQRKPHEDIFEALAGCTEQCPFCKAQCERTVDKHFTTGNIKHTAQHRPQCLGKRRLEKDLTMVLDICTYSVSQGFNAKFKTEKTEWKPHPYKRYFKDYPEWDIIADKSPEASLYWKWFIGKYSRKIELFFESSRTYIPREWKKLDWNTDVKEWLKREYNV